MTGTMDHPVLQNVSDEAKEWLQHLSKIAHDVNEVYAKKLNIGKAAAVTCVKPEGTSSALNDSASGIHPRYSEYYIRRVRADDKDPLAIVMREQGFYCEQDVMQPSTLVFSFPVKAPSGSVFRDDRTAIEQLEYWLMWKQYWCDSHNPSVTIYVREHEWLAVGAWVYSHFDEVCGLSFLPHSDHIYQQAPYEECNKAEYDKLLSVTPTYIDYEALHKLENKDMTTSSQEYACSAGVCSFA